MYNTKTVPAKGRISKFFFIQKNGEERKVQKKRTSTTKVAPPKVAEMIFCSAGCAPA